VKRSGPPKRRLGLRADPTKVLAWRERSRKAIPYASPKRKREALIRAEVREECFVRDRVCVAKALCPDVACAPGLECDEIEGRGRKPGSHLVLDDTQALCPICHMLKTRYVRCASLLGLYGDAAMDKHLEGLDSSGRLLAALEAVHEWERRKRQARS